MYGKTVTTLHFHKLISILFSTHTSLGVALSPHANRLNILPHCRLTGSDWPSGASPASAITERRTGLISRVLLPSNPTFSMMETEPSAVLRSISSFDTRL